MAIPLRILLIEDSDDDALLLVHELRRGGYDPTWRRVDTPEALRAALREGEWDVITCDWVMPRFSASAALQLLRDTGCERPIIIVSGEVGEEVAVSAMKSGAQDFVSKHALTRLVPAVERELREFQEHQARRQAEASLSHVQQRWHAFVEQASDVIFTLDAEGRFTSVNRAASELSGYAVEELIGRSAIDLLASEDRPDAAAVLAAIWAGRESPLSEYDIVTKDGRRRRLEMRGRAIEVEGRLVESFHIARDVTERRRADAERARLSAALEQAAEPIVITDPDGRIVYVNPAAEQSTGYSRAELCGEPYEVLVGGLHDAAAARDTATVIRSGGVWAGSGLQRRKDGTLHRIEVTVSPVRDRAGRVVNYVGIGRRAGDEPLARAHG